MAFNRTFSHAVIANVVSGHVYVIRAKDRKIIASVAVGEQAHHAEIAPDGGSILVANQNGKRLARIRADNLTGGPTAKGETPGVVVFEVTDEGRGGRRSAFIPIGDQTPASPNDPHVVAVRSVR